MPAHQLALERALPRAPDAGQDSRVGTPEGQGGCQVANDFTRASGWEERLAQHVPDCI